MKEASLRVMVSCGLALVLAIAGAGAAAPLRSSDNEVEHQDWSFDVVPYLWVAGISVETGVPASAPAGVDHFATRISAGAMMAAQARYRSVGMFVDFAWLRLNTEAINPGPAYSAVDLRSDFIHETTALTYRLPTGEKLRLDLLAGARFWHVNENLNFHAGALPALQTDATLNWVDPVVGANLGYDFNRRWFLTSLVMVGGFGVASEFMADVFVGGGYRFTDWCSATAGYRFVHEEYDRNGYALKSDIQGLLLGIGFHF
jgi:hypothetical protein